MNSIRQLRRTNELAYVTVAVTTAVTMVPGYPSDASCGSCIHPDAVFSLTPGIQCITKIYDRSIASVFYTGLTEAMQLLRKQKSSRIYEVRSAVVISKRNAKAVVKLL